MAPSRPGAERVGQRDQCDAVRILRDEPPHGCGGGQGFQCQQRDAHATNRLEARRDGNGIRQTTMLVYG
jgi:hypothetical protein